MNPLEGVRRAWAFGVRRLLSLWIKVTVKPEDVAATIAARPHPVCYVLERQSQSDLAALNLACAAARLPRPERRLLIGGRRAARACVELSVARRPFGPRHRGATPRDLADMVAAAGADPAFDVDLVPVAVFFGRAPGKELGPWRLLFAEDWALAGRFRALLRVLFNGRRTLVYFGAPVRLQNLLLEGAAAGRNARRAQRLLRAQIAAQRASTIGPDLSHRRTLVAQILRTREVRQAVRRSVDATLPAARAQQRRAGLERARKYAVEIAANYSQSFVTLMSGVLARVWNRLYDGVEFRHVERLREAGDDAAIIYVPCHRSHMDYLLLSYVIYRKGFAVPHVAAGINLNLPVIGRFLRMGGAFFLRRSFKGDPLYAIVFTRYLGFMMARGHPLEYFIEGGRSRTGRMLAPRSGMLAMTVRSYLREPRRPVVFVPVYFGYERIVEGRTYIGELSGRPKEKETLLGLLKATFRVLRSNFGKVRVNLGAPIALDEVLHRRHPGWRAEAVTAEGQPPAPWLAAVVDDLAQSIVRGINAAAAVSPINLVATAMLATPRQAMVENDLVAQLELYRRLLTEAPYGALVTICEHDGAAMVRYCEALGLLDRQTHPLGDILRMSADNSLRATYYRNNVLHLVALPSLLACGFLGNERLADADIQRLVWRAYPYVAAELFLRWDESEVPGVVDALLQTFARLGLLERDAAGDVWRRPPPTSPMAARLTMLAQSTLQTLERYYLVIALLLQAGSGALSRDALEQRCQWVAQRMAALHGLDSPEFFDRALFRNFLELLLRRGVIERTPDDTLAYGAALHAVAADAQGVLSEQLRQNILQVTLGP